MARGKPPKTRKPRIAPARPVSYPIGTRLAENYGLDLDREAREGRPAERIGMPPAVEPEAVHPVTIVAYATLIGVVLWIAYSATTGIMSVVKHRREAALRKAAPVFFAHHWTDKKAASIAGALTDGWVPRFVPDEATDIRECHDPLDGESWLGFRFPPARGAAMIEGMTRCTPDHLAMMVVAGPEGSWWPESLRGRISRRTPGVAWDVFFTHRWTRRKGNPEVIAIDWKASRAFVWREARR